MRPSLHRGVQKVTGEYKAESPTYEAWSLLPYFYVSFHYLSTYVTILQVNSSWRMSGLTRDGICLARPNSQARSGTGKR